MSPSTPRFLNIYLPAEDVESYNPGGYHPVHFHETNNGVYRVVRKLGYGSFSTVWMARNISDGRYVALKILTAKHSAQTSELDILRHLTRLTDEHPGRLHVTPLLDSFVHHGPNGKHLCLVLEPMGPNVDIMEQEFGLPNEPWIHVYPKAVSKEISRQAILALDYLHKNSIVHGDLQPGNILFTIQDLTSVNEQELSQEQNQNEDTIAHVKRLDGQELDESTPKYIVAPQPLTDKANTAPGFQIKISDMGAGFSSPYLNYPLWIYSDLKPLAARVVAFWSHKPPKSTVTPVALRAPELILLDTWDSSIDVWSLGCVIFQLVTGTPLFTLWTSDPSMAYETDDEHILQLIEIIGPLPDNLRCKCTRSQQYFDADGEYKETREPHLPLEQLVQQHKPKDMCDGELLVFVALMRSMLRYEPSVRITPDALSAHPWFGDWVDRGCRDGLVVNMRGFGSCESGDEPDGSDEAGVLEARRSHDAIELPGGNRQHEEKL